MEEVNSYVIIWFMWVGWVLMCLYSDTLVHVLSNKYI